MTRRRALCTLLPAVLLLAGCGGSSHSTTSAASSTASASTTSISSTSTSATTTSSSGSASVSASASTSSKIKPNNGNHVYVDARFAVQAGGRLSPAQVSVPGSVAVALIVVSKDTSAHEVQLAGKKLSVPAGRQASTLVKGLRNGHHEITVDGSQAGALVVGVAPGP